MLIIVVAVVALTLAGVLVGQNYVELQNLTGANPTDTAVPTFSSTPTPTTTSSPLPRATEAPTATPLESVKIDSVSIDNGTAASVTASSQTGQDIVITKIILKDASGNMLATDDSIHQTLSADGTSIKITINQHNADFDMGGNFMLTIVTSDGISFTSPICSPLFY